MPYKENHRDIIISDVGETKQLNLLDIEDNDTDSIMQEQPKHSVEDMADEIKNDYESTSFAELEQSMDCGNFDEDFHDLLDVFFTLVSNVFNNPKVQDKEGAIKVLITEFSDRTQTIIDNPQNKSFIEKIKEILGKAQNYKTDGGIKFYASDFLFVPDPAKPSSWKLRISEGKSGNVTVAQLGRAAAALSSAGFMGNQVQGIGDKRASIISKLRAEYKKLGVSNDKLPEVLKKEKGMFVWKDTDGGYRWFGIYSNMYRDVEEEIISKASHKRYVEMVDKGEYPMPELWLWHVPGSAIGVADWVSFDDQTGFAMASGTVKKEFSNVAENLSGIENLAMSHGMSDSSVKRDNLDKSVIIEHQTVEVSALPLESAANKLTDWSLIDKEEIMGIPDVKLSFLKTVGLTDAAIEDINNKLSGKAKEAETMQLDSKDVSVVSEVVEENVEQNVEVELVVEADATVSKESELLLIAKSIETLTSAITEQFVELKQRVAELEIAKDTRTKEDKEVETAMQLTPSESLAAVIAKSMSLIGAKETQIRKNDELNKTSPEQTSVEKSTPVVTGNSVLDSAIFNIVGGKRNN